ncbi:hypothetical protein XNC3_900002 [Xenorhabdus nematophila F1]|nr:hypothetical protein XNC3_900002 [Xenorhabdus nematophila F1]
MGYTHELLAINQTAFAEAQKKYNSFIKHAKNRVVSETGREHTLINI